MSTTSSTAQTPAAVPPDDHALEPALSAGMPLAALAWDARPQRAGAVVLVLHGGAVDGFEPNHPWSHNVARLVPFARALKKVPGPLAVARLRFRVRGWNGDELEPALGAGMPVVDGRWAIRQIRETYPGVPIALVGHSMGGRVAMHVGDDDDVRLVVALAPWVEASDPWPGDGRRTILIHGDRDVICSLARSRERVEKMQADGLNASLVRVARSDHAMLVRANLWTVLVTEIVAATFAAELGGSGEPRSGPIGAVVAQVVHGGGVTIDI